jgi:putative transposase
MLARTFGCARVVYNWGLTLRSDAYRQRGEHVFYRDTSAAPLSTQTGSSLWLVE